MAKKAPAKAVVKKAAKKPAPKAAKVAKGMQPKAYPTFMYRENGEGAIFTNPAAFAEADDGKWYDTPGGANG